MRALLGWGCEKPPGTLSLSLSLPQQCVRELSVQVKEPRSEQPGSLRPGGQLSWTLARRRRRGVRKKQTCASPFRSRRCVTPALTQTKGTAVCAFPS